MHSDLSAARPPLTQLSDEELMFRDAVAAFAEEEVRPRVRQMEDAGKLDTSIIAGSFELGLMGIEVPEALGGAGGTLFMVALAVEEISKVDASSAILVDVQNTLVNFPIHRYGSDYIKSTYLPRLTEVTTDFLYLRWLGERRAIEHYDRVQIDRSVSFDAWECDLRAALPRVREVYGYFNNHWAGHSPASANEMKRRLGLVAVDWRERWTQRELF